MRGLMLATNPVDAASTRFRVMQYLPRLAQAGIEIDVSPFFPAGSGTVLYQPGRFLRKAGLVCRGIARRLHELRTAGSRYQFLLIHREYFPLGQRIAWRELRALRVPILFDFDDAMFLPQRTDRQVVWRLAERPDTAAEVIKLSRGVIAGNEYLAGFARQWNANVVVVPTVVDVNQFALRNGSVPSTHPCVVGWIGTPSTAKYLPLVREVLGAVAHESPFTFRVVGASPTEAMFPGVSLEVVPWQLAQEVTLFQGCDIGIYPLTEDPWSFGKCAFKAIQFMAVGTPVIASDVGMNREVIQHGVTGFLVRTEAQWRDALLRLIRDPELRRTMGIRGRTWVVEHFNLDRHTSRVEDFIRKMVDGPAAS